MNKILLAVSVAAMAACTSCNKEELSTNVPTHEGFNVSILGEMGEFAATKSTAESCIRLKWEAKDKVYAYGSTGSSIDSLGCLTVAIEGDNNYVALMTGTLKQAPSDNKLYLVHCPLLTAGPSISEGAISLSLASQPSTCIPFVAYATVTGVSATAQKNLRASFSFASSVIKANVYGIANSTTMLSATLSDVNTACKITFGETIAVAGETAGVISKTLSASSSASGKADFYIAVPAIAAASGRTLIVKAGGTWYIKEGAVTKAHAENAYINTICDMTPHPNAYVDEKGCYHGDGIEISTSGGTKVWAPVNCGYDATNYTCGLLYQWGRHDGCGYNDGSTKETLIQENYSTGNTQVDGSTVKEDATKFYWGYNLPRKDWLATQDDARWNSGTEGVPAKTTYDPCPEGWRVPTLDELGNLCYTDWNSSSKLGTSTRGSWDGTKGGWNFDTLFLPAAGYRDEDNGNAANRGASGSGSYWSSSPSTTYTDKVERLYLTYSTANMSYGTYRARGCSVRCVQE